MPAPDVIGEAVKRYRAHQAILDAYGVRSHNELFRFQLAESPYMGDTWEKVDAYQLDKDRQTIIDAYLDLDELQAAMKAKGMAAVMREMLAPKTAEELAG